MLYSAAKGMGAFLNETIRLPLTLSSLTALPECLLLTEFGTNWTESMLQPKMKTINQLLSSRNIRGIRCLGSAACNLGMIAKGFGDI